MLYIIFQYDWEAVQIHWILIGFETMMENVIVRKWMHIKYWSSLIINYLNFDLVNKNLYKQHQHLSNQRWQEQRHTFTISISLYLSDYIYISIYLTRISLSLLKLASRFKTSKTGTNHLWSVLWFVSSLDYLQFQRAFTKWF